jgi:acetoin utilization protein AcuB
MAADTQKRLTVGDRMSPDPVTVGREQSLRHALEAMELRGIRHLPVVEDGKVVGLVTDRDVREAMPSPEIIAEIREAQSFLAMVQVAEVMSEPVVSVEPDLPLRDAASLMVERPIGALPVLSDGRLVGILTTSDILRAFIDLG